MHSWGYILVGSTFPLCLIYRPVTITFEKVEAVRKLPHRKPIISFWSHQSSIPLANKSSDVDVNPSTSKRALQLTSENFPILKWFPTNGYVVLYPDNLGGI